MSLHALMTQCADAPYLHVLFSCPLRAGEDGNGEFKESTGTGLGDGSTEGAKDISDKLENEDQLLGAQQRDAEQKQEEQGPVEDSAKGIEMEADFDGAMHDMPEEEGDRDRDSEDEEGDDERIDQQMGDVGEENEVSKHTTSSTC